MPQDAVSWCKFGSGAFRWLSVTSQPRGKFPTLPQDRRAARSVPCGFPAIMTVAIMTLNTAIWSRRSRRRQPNLVKIQRANSWRHFTHSFSDGRRRTRNAEPHFETTRSFRPSRSPYASLRGFQARTMPGADKVPGHPTLTELERTGGSRQRLSTQ
jgi:hypothetical protein